MNDSYFDTDRDFSLNIDVFCLFQWGKILNPNEEERLCESRQNMNDGYLDTELDFLLCIDEFSFNRENLIHLNEDEPLYERRET